MKTIHLPEGIEVTIADNGNVSLISELREYCLGCGKADCYFDCDDSQDAPESKEEALSRLQWNAAVDGVEGMILTLAGAGVDVDTYSFRNAIEATLNKLAEQYA